MDGMQSQVSLAKHIESFRLVLESKKLHSTLTVINRRLRELSGEHACSSEDVQHYQDMLDELGERWQDSSGCFAGELDEVDPPAAEACRRLWAESHELAEGMLKEAQEMPPDVRGVHARLLALKHRIAVLRAEDHTLWDVLPLERQLDAIDADRLSYSGFFGGDADQPAPGNEACSQLLNECYDLIADCLHTVNDMPPEMQALCKKLRGLKNGLRKLQAKKRHTLEDVQRFTLELDSISRQRQEGVFCGEPETGKIPPGQATAAQLLADCYELVEELKTSAARMPDVVARVRMALGKHLTSLEALRLRPHTAEEVRKIQTQVDALDYERQQHGGVFGGDLEAGQVPPGQTVCASLMSDCYRLIQQLYEGAVSSGATFPLEE